jgi:hypothetical protein
MLTVRKVLSRVWVICFLLVIGGPVGYVVIEYLNDLRSGAFEPVQTDYATLGWKWENKFIEMADLTYRGVWGSVRSATAYYVSPTGSGFACSNPAPCSGHIAAGAHDLSAFNPQPDDVLNWEPGHYVITPSTILTFKQEGAQFHPVINQAQYTLGKVAIDCNYDGSGIGNFTCIGFLPSPPGAQPEKGQWIRISRFFVYNSNTTSIRSCAGCLNFPLDMLDGMQVNGAGKEFIGNWVYDAGDGLESFLGTAGMANYGGHVIRGNHVQYSGYIDTTTRGSGHGGYLENNDKNGEVGRSVWEGNVFLRSFDVEVQIYGSTGPTSYITFQNNVLGPGGIPIATPWTWPAVACCANTLYAGSLGDMNEEANECREPGAPLGSKGLYRLSLLNNLVYGGNSSMTWGSAKGMCDDVIQGNQFLFTGGTSVTCNKQPYGPTPTPPALTATPGPSPTPNCASGSCCHNLPGDTQKTDGLGCGFYSSTRLTPTPGNTTMVIGGAGSLANNFYGPTPVAGTGCPLPGFGPANWPQNTWAASAALPGTQIAKVWASPDFPGEGWIALYNGTGAANYSVNLDTLVDTVTGQHPLYPGERIRFQNWQDVDPYDATKDVLTVDCTATCGTQSLPTAAVSIRQPAFLNSDGVALFPKPPDLQQAAQAGFVVWWFYPRWEAGAYTPTPTLTFTVTNSPTVGGPTSTQTLTPSPTLTRTPTFTPSNTATGTITPTATLTSTQTFTPTLTSTPTLTPTNTPTPTVTPVIGTQLWGVNQCVALSPMVIVADPSANSGYHSTSAVVNGGLLTCTFNVAQDGTYRMYVHEQSFDFNDDSYWISVDGDNPSVLVTPTPTPVGAIAGHVFDANEFKQPCIDSTGGSNFCITGNWTWPTGAFVWNIFNDRLATCGNCTGTLTERDLPLTVAGNPHTLQLRTREAQNGLATYLDQFYLTCTSCDAPPPQPTPVGGFCTGWAICNHKAGPVKIPCSSVPTNKIIPCPFSP